MNQDRLVGSAKNLAGKVEEGFGKATGDASTEASGKMKQVEGDLQDLYGQDRRTSREGRTRPGIVIRGDGSRHD